MWQTKTPVVECHGPVPGDALAWIKGTARHRAVRTAADPTFRVIAPPSTTGEG